MKKPDSVIKLLTLAEAASILKISKRTLHRMIQNRQIPAFKVGGQWRILESRFPRVGPRRGECDSKSGLDTQNKNTQHMKPFRLAFLLSVPAI